MNIYKYQFVSTCPANGKEIVYQFTIETQQMVLVEHLITACAMYRRAYHEHIADALQEQFGGKHTLVAHHHGVDITTIRGEV